MLNTPVKLYRIENNQRIYSSDVDVENIFYSEINLHFLDYLNIGGKIFYLKGDSKHAFSLNNQELDYLNTWGLRYEETLDFVFSKNIKNIKCAQKFDLFFLINLKNLYFICLLPKLTSNNVYYFDLILCVKPKFDISVFYNWNLHSINIQNAIELTNLNLTEKYLEQIFDFLNNKFRDDRINKKEALIYQKHFDGPTNNINTKLTKTGRRIYKKIIFKHVCFHFYWMTNDVLKLNNTQFWMDWGYKDKIATVDEKGDLQIKEFYHPSSLLDVMCCNFEYICFSCWECFEDG